MPGYQSPNRRGRRRPDQDTYLLHYDEAGKLVRVASPGIRDDFAQQIKNDGLVYWIRGSPRHYCPPREEDCHTDDLSFCWDKGHYRKETT